LSEQDPYPILPAYLVTVAFRKLFAYLHFIGFVGTAVTFIQNANHCYLQEGCLEEIAAQKETHGNCAFVSLLLIYGEADSSRQLLLMFSAWGLIMFALQTGGVIFGQE